MTATEVKEGAKNTKGPKIASPEEAPGRPEGGNPVEVSNNMAAEIPSPEVPQAEAGDTYLWGQSGEYQHATAPTTQRPVARPQAPAAGTGRQPGFKNSAPEARAKAAVQSLEELFEELFKSNLKVLLMADLTAAERIKLLRVMQEVALTSMKLQ